jgi:hypothetical protein
LLIIVTKNPNGMQNTADKGFASKMCTSRLHVASFLRYFLVLSCSIILIGAQSQAVFAAQQSKSGSTGIEGTIPSAPPQTAATISIPKNGQTFSTTPITVSGICQSGLLVEIFDNNVFVGSASCKNGSYSLQIDLFDGQNDLVAKVFDALNQTGPDSSTITVFFRSAIAAAGTRPTLTTSFAKRGADPGTTLTWPISLSGGSGPYAISVDWGDKTALDLISRSTPGTFNIEHIYAQSGVYNVTIKVTDANGSAAFLQLVGISNGPIQQTTSSSQAGGTVTTKKVIIWWPLAITFALSILAFWLGKRHQLQTIRDRLHRGERPI